jgi:tetratricopeptide (TPR) repeat protein
MSDLGEDEEQTGSYSIYFAEGEALAKQKQFQKAIESFTKALEFQPEDRPCLVERSKCHLQLGDTSAALADAEASLKEDKTYHRVRIIL